MRARMLPHQSAACRHRRGGQAERLIDEHERDDARTAVRTPSGPAAADEAFAWLNRQLSWQSTLAELEAGFADTGVATAGDEAQPVRERASGARPAT
jgi:hypothetical protein